MRNGTSKEFMHVITEQIANVVIRIEYLGSGSGALRLTGIPDSIWIGSGCRKKHDLR
jgi:hypothetical protein